MGRIQTSKQVSSGDLSFALPILLGSPCLASQDRNLKELTSSVKSRTLGTKFIAAIAGLRQ